MIEARIAAEQGARKALDALAVGRHEPYGTMSAELRVFRNRLRAHGRQLGDILDKQKGSQATRRLEREVAYEHWHRMLFARFLAENGLLIEPESSVAVTLEECEDLAREQGVDAWVLAASYAQGMLPQIFRPDDPALAVTLPPETRQSLQRLLADLPAEVFTADDSLGWTYQFWQSAEKDAVNARVQSGEKITGETLPAVTQLFTEHYMVQFLLHNTIGAWHAGKTLTDGQRESADSEQALRDAVRLAPLDSYDFEYLRFVREAREDEGLNAGTGPWRPAAGFYDGWPKTAAELRVLDPCCGSGHFLVATFHLLVRLRIAEEGLDIEDAIKAVLAENLFGLELDSRCTQIAAFNLAFAAWKVAGKPIDLPTPNVACSGIGPHSTIDEWRKMAKVELANEPGHVRQAMERGLVHMHNLFSDAPELGSLIDPSQLPTEGFAADFESIKPLLDRILAAESTDDETIECAVTARGIAAAAEIIAGDFTLVITNVPYLGRRSQGKVLYCFGEKNFDRSKADLATMMLDRWVRSLVEGGTFAHVTRDNWLFQHRYKDLRHDLLGELAWTSVARLGSGAFESLTGQVVNAALVVVSRQRRERHAFFGIDVGAEPRIADKTRALRGSASSLFDQASQRISADSRIVLDELASGEVLSEFANSWQGIATSDDPRFTEQFWEQAGTNARWHLYVRVPERTDLYCGRSQLVMWEDGNGQMTSICQENAQYRGRSAWGRRGIAIHTMSELRATIYAGEKFSRDVSIIEPHDQDLVAAFWLMCQSEEYLAEVRKLDRALRVTNTSLVKVEADLDHWQAVAAKEFPNGLPEPRSDDPTQWLFHGRPERAEAHATLQVAVARLLGYLWPAELDQEMRLAPEARALANCCADLAEFADDDGIVCLSSVQGEGSAADRVRSLLAKAFGQEWSAAKEQDLLRAAGERLDKGKSQHTLEDWLRDRFFEEHCALFHDRPFVWHIWDGLPGGFHALVNYHKLASPAGQGRRTLEKLTSTYLGEWIDRQRQLATAGEEGADGRLAAALTLQAELRKILEGEPPYDIFVRWKPLHEQPLGWDPDINDGVRLNIRPFLSAKDMGKKNAGILRAKPDNTWCNGKKPGVMDRGKEPESLRPREHFPWFWSCDPEQHPEHRKDFGASTPGATAAGKAFTGVRWNGLHYTRAAKEAARRAAANRGAVEEAGS